MTHKASITHDLTLIPADERHGAILSQLRAALDRPYHIHTHVPMIISKMTRCQLETMLMELLREKQEVKK